jgi:hypothetical protein
MNVILPSNFYADGQSSFSPNNRLTAHITICTKFGGVLSAFISLIELLSILLTAY